MEFVKVKNQNNFTFDKSMFINYAFNKISNFTRFSAFELLLFASITFIILFAMYKFFTSDKGTWSDKKYYDMIPYGRSNTNKGRSAKLSKGEAECKRVLEKIFKKPFNNIRPDFLSNPVTGGKNLELDCYNEELKLAVEYNGRQHYEYSPYFHKNKDQLETQKYRDMMKRNLCKENNVTLIEVPYTVKIENIEIL